MRARTIVCPCEDVEVEELHAAVRRGYRDLETLKRATGATTGPCQGKWCLAATMRVLAATTGIAPEALGQITHRPPLKGVPLGALARCPLAEDGP